MRAAAGLLAAHPSQEPSTRELYEAAGVAAPTLYHHFGTKTGLLDAVVEQAFDAYLEQKRGMVRTGDLIADFCAGWDLHIEFGLTNPMAYTLMYLSGRITVAAETADRHLRAALERMRDASLLHVDIDTAATMTTAMAIGCVTQLNRQPGVADESATRAIRTALVDRLTGQPQTTTTPRQAAHALLNDLRRRSEMFTPAESALLRQWLLAIADEDHPTSTSGAHA